MLLPASSSLASLYGGKNLHDFGIQLRKFQSQYAFARMQHQIERRGQVAQMLPHRGAHAPADAITDHRSAQYFTDGKADSRSCGALMLAVKSRHVPGKMFPAVLVDRLKIRVLQQSRTPGEALRHFVRSFFHGWSGRQHGHLQEKLLPEARLHGNALASFGAATGQYGPSALCFHSRAKTVHLGAATPVGLKSALGH
jgi:hypothetical protein